MRLTQLGLLLIVLYGALLDGRLVAQDRNWDDWNQVLDPSFVRNPDRQVLRGFRVPEVAEAARLIAQARASIAEGSYSAAVDDLIEVISTYRDAVFQVGRESMDGASCSRFVGAAELAHYLLASLPPSGREIYDALASKRGALKLVRARDELDLQALERLAVTYASSSVGLSALDVLADYYLEQGEAELAVLLLKSWLLYAQDRDATIVARLVQALDQAGRDGEAADYLELLGEQPSWKERLTSDLDANAPILGDSGSDWTTTGGSPNRNRSMPRLPGAGLASAPRWTVSAFNTRLSEENPFCDDQDNPVPYRVLRSGGMLYINDSVSTRAFSVYSGELVWHFLGPLERFIGNRSYFDLGDYTSMGYSRQPGTISPHLLAGGTVEGDVLLVNLQAERPWRKKKYLYRDVINKPIPVRHLFALALQDGSLLWRQAGRDYDPESFMNRLSIASPPVVIGDRVFCEGHLVEGGIRTFVLCFHLQSGELIWKTPVGVGQQQLTMFNMNFQEFAATPLTYCDGTLYYCSNLGFIAAVEALSGRIRWITEYENIPLPEISHYTDPSPRQVYWYNEPPRVSDDRLVATPLDAETMVSLDRHRGRIAWSLAARRLWSSDCRYLMGIREGRVLVGGSGGAAAFDLQTGYMLWRTPTYLDREPCLGRGALVNDRVILSLGGMLVEVDDASGKILAERAMGEMIDVGQNLFFLGDIAVRVTVDSVRVSFNARGMLTEALGRLADSRALGDRQRHFDDLVLIGDLYRLEGLLNQADDFYQRALALEPDGNTLDFNRVRSGLFHIHYERAVEALGRMQRQSAEKYLLSAAEFAPAPRDEIEALSELSALYLEDGRYIALDETLTRLERRHALVRFNFGSRFGLDECKAGFFASVVRARAASDQGNWTDLVAALQSVIEKYPSESVRINRLRGEQSREWAVARIGKLIEEHGRGVYGAYETRANTLFEEALAAGSPDRLRSLALRFPNALASSRAVLERARLLLDQGRAVEAYRELSWLVSREASGESVPHALFLMARAAQREGNAPLARALFDRVRTRFGRVPAIWEEGVTYGRLIAADTPSRPVPELPRRLPRAPLRQREHVFSSPHVELVTLHGDRSPAMNDKLLFHLILPERLVLFDLVTQSPVWENSISLPEDEPPRHVFITGEVLSVCCDRFLAGYSLVDGRTLWTHGLPGWVVDVHSAPGVLRLVHAPIEEDGWHEITAECINSVTGATLWQKTLDHGEEAQIIRHGDVFALLVDRQEVVVLDQLTGAENWRKTLDFRRASVLLFDSPPGRLLLRVQDEESKLYILLAIDISTGREAWRFELGERAIVRNSVMLCPDGVLALSGGNRSAGFEKQLVLLDAFSGKIRKSCYLAQADTLVCDDTKLTSSRVYVRPIRINQLFGLSAFDLGLGRWVFEDIRLDLKGQGGRSPNVQRGAYAGDGLVLAVNYAPSRRDERALQGRIFLVGGDHGELIFTRDLKSAKGLEPGQPIRKEIQAEVTEQGVIVVWGNTLILIEEKR